MPWADLAGFAAVLGVIAAVGVRRASSATGYMVADRSIGLWALVATLVMTEFNTSTLVAFSAAGYGAGPMALALPAVFLIGLSFYTVTVARAWKRFDRLSVAELFAARYSSSMGRLASALLLLAMAGFSATYVKSLTLLFAPFAGDVPTWVLSALLSTVVVLAVIGGGLVSVVRADQVSVVITLIVLPVLCVLGLRAATQHGGLASVFPADQLLVDPVAQWRHPALPMRFVTSLAVLTCFTYIAAPWYGQKIFAARDERTALLAVGLSAVLVFLLYGSMVLAAAALRVEVPTLPDPQTALPEMIRRWLPAGARGAGFAMLFAAALTTLAGVWSAMATMVAADFGGERSIGGQRAWIAAFAVVSWLGANLLVDDILNRLILANIPVAALAFALLAGFHWPRATTAGAWASVAVGMGWGIWCFVRIGDAGMYTWDWGVYGIPLIFAVGIVTSLVTSRRAPVPLPS
jgi:solute:Na+ symporter, SSS family